MALAAICSGCATSSGVLIPDSLKAPCESTVDVSTAQTVGDLGRAVLQGDADLAICSLKKDAIVEIAEGERRPWWSLLRPG